MFRKWFIVAAMCLLMPASALAQEVPDLTGAWVSSETQSVFAGPGTRHHQTPGDNVTFSNMDMSLEITEQQGRMFHGAKSSPNHTESFVGGLAFDGVTLWFAEEEGIMQGRLVSPTEMELVYIHETADTDVVAVVRYVKQ